MQINQDPIPGLLHQKLWGRGPAICVLTGPPRHAAKI